MTRKQMATFRKKHNLPYRCECGGVMGYTYDFGRVFSWCKKCSPVQHINVSKLRGK